MGLEESFFFLAGPRGKGCHPHNPLRAGGGSRKSHDNLLLQLQEKVVAAPGRSGPGSTIRLFARAGAGNSPTAGWARQRKRAGESESPLASVRRSFALRHMPTEGDGVSGGARGALVAALGNVLAFTLTGP